ncbi:MAG: DNA repair protein RecO [Pseudomonadota bacterium]
MEWRDEALILSARPFGENSKIVDLFAVREGRAAGLVRGARSRGTRATVQPGNRVFATWRGRLDGQLGTLQLEMIEARAGQVMDHAVGAFGLQALAALLGFLPERDPHPRLYAAANVLIDAFDNPADAGETAVRFELIFLEEFGYGLDLSACAATGTTDDLVYVSPRSGRAVSRAAGAPYADRMLPLPAFLKDEGPVNAASLEAGFRLTSHFLTSEVAALAGKPLPPARERFVRAVLKAAARAP